MTSVPIVEVARPSAPDEWKTAAVRLAQTLRSENQHLRLPNQFKELAVRQIDDGPTLHIDDLSEITRLDGGHDARFYQDRARLRAGDGDLIASCGDPVPGLESYCRDYLGLGSPEWLRPSPPGLPLRIAEACWEDPVTRQRLIAKLNQHELRYIHPHMGTFSVWELAFLLNRETGRPLSVIAPPPGVTRWVNDKIEFANTVTRLFGRELVPRTESASNLAYMAKRVRDLADKCEMLGLKLPNSGGGDGNLVIQSEEFRGRPLEKIRGMLQDRLQALAWDGTTHVLIDCWETEVVCTPSAQLWIPPGSDYAPIVEGVFLQRTEGAAGSFVGSLPAHLPPRLHQEIVDRCWVLSVLFQELGYVGRCSFDMILVGQSLDDCRVEFVECNGRWGGTSLPMTLMNRIFRDGRQHPYAVRVVHHLDPLNRLGFPEVLEHFEQELYDVRTGSGSLIFINPGRLKYQSGITVIALDNSWEGAVSRLTEMPQQLRQLAESRIQPITTEAPRAN